MEDEVFDGVNDYHQYFGSNGWASFVEDGLPVSDFTAQTDRVSRVYGSVIFAKYLSEHVGGRKSMADVWALIRGGRRILFDDPGGTRVANGALNAYAVQQEFAGIEQLFLGFAAANATMDYREGASYRLSAAEAVPVRSSTLSADSATGLQVPRYLGATYLRSRGGTGAPVEVSLAATPSTAWGLAFAVARAEGYSLALGELAPAGTPSLGIASLGTGDTLYAIPSFLDPSGQPSRYVTTESRGLAPDTTPPSPVDLASAPLARAGGFDLAWVPSGDPGLAGYVVRWSPAGGTGSQGARTLFGPVSSVEIRGLSLGSYTVEVFPYDTAGNADPANAATAALVVSEPGGDTPTPPAAALEPGASSPPATAVGDGGGGGGGCFLRALSW
jgi:hypothetical protein